jgi:hypothetical protein
MRRNILGASNTLLVEWTIEDRDMYKNHLRMSREQFFGQQHFFSDLSTFASSEEYRLRIDFSFTSS